MTTISPKLAGPQGSAAAPLLRKRRLHKKRHTEEQTKKSTFPTTKDDSVFRSLALGGTVSGMALNVPYVCAIQV